MTAWSDSPAAAIVTACWAHCCCRNRTDNPTGNPVPSEVDCGVDPYVIVPDQCAYVDQQTLKLQEVPDSVPTGEMPRHVIVSVER